MGTQQYCLPVFWKTYSGDVHSVNGFNSDQRMHKHTELLGTFPIHTAKSIQLCATHNSYTL